MLTNLEKAADLFFKTYPKTIETGGVDLEPSFAACALMIPQNADGSKGLIQVLDPVTNTFRDISSADLMADRRIASASGKLGFSTGSGGAVTQATNSATAVTLNKSNGQITTVALTTAAAAEERFTVNNSLVAATDVIVVSTTYNGNGTPAVSVLHTAAGAFDIVITNLHASAALNAAMVINFAVIKAVAA